MDMGLDTIGRIHSHESAGTVDGPGIRYVVFLQGCPLRCKFCHNPDTWGINSGEELSARELADKIVRYKSFMDFSGGGVTVTGGEPLLQKKFVYELFKELKHLGISTAIDTSGYTKIDDDLNAVLDFTDLVMLDIKQLDKDRHKDLTGVYNDVIFDFLKHLKERKIRTWVRYVVVAGMNDSDEYAYRFADFIKGYENVELVEILPYHEMGKMKWEKLGLKYQLSPSNIPDRKRIKEIGAILNGKGIKTLGDK